MNTHPADDGLEEFEQSLQRDIYGAVEGSSAVSGFRSDYAQEQTKKQRRKAWRQQSEEFHALFVECRFDAIAEALGFSVEGTTAKTKYKPGKAVTKLSGTRGTKPKSFENQAAQLDLLLSTKSSKSSSGSNASTCKLHLCCSFHRNANTVAGFFRSLEGTASEELVPTVEVDAQCPISVLDRATWDSEFPHTFTIELKEFVQDVSEWLADHGALTPAAKRAAKDALKKGSS